MSKTHVAICSFILTIILCLYSCFDHLADVYVWSKVNNNVQQKIMEAYGRGWLDRSKHEEDAAKSRERLKRSIQNHVTL